MVLYWYGTEVDRFALRVIVGCRCWASVIGGLTDGKDLTYWP